MQYNTLTIIRSYLEKELTSKQKTLKYRNRQDRPYYRLELIQDS